MVATIRAWIFACVFIIAAPAGWAASTDSVKGRGYQGPAAVSERLALVSISSKVLAVRRRSDQTLLATLTSPKALAVAAMSPGETSVAAASRDGKIMLWSLPEGRLVATVAAHDDEVTALAFSPSGTQLASASRDATVRTWDPATGNPLRALRGHNAAVLSVAYSLQEDRLASAAEDSTIRLWNPMDGSSVKVIRTGVLDNPAVVAFSPSGAVVASSGHTGRVRLWRTVDGLVSKSFSCESPAKALTFSPSGDLLVAAQRDGNASVWRTSDGEQAQLHKLEGDKVAAVRITDSETHIAAVGERGSIAVFEAPPRPELVAAAARKAPQGPDELRNMPGYRTTRRNAFAVIVGVERYRDLVAADYAAEDAAIMKDYFRHAMGVPAENIALLVDDRASLGDLKGYLEHWLKQNVRPDSDVFVYYSGHGTPDPENGTGYLVPYDAVPESIRERGYALSALYGTLSSLPLRRAVVMLDACFSGAGGPRTVIAKGARPIVATIEDPLLASGKISVLAASTGAQISGTLDDKRHGLFTYFLAKGLQGAADLNSDKAISLGELYEYLRPEVTVRAREKNREQQPTFLPGLPDKKWADESLVLLE